MKSLAVRGRLSGSGSGEAQPIHDAANASQAVNKANRTANVSVRLFLLSSFILQPSSFHLSLHPFFIAAPAVAGR